MPTFVGDLLSWVVGLVETLGMPGLAIVVALENVFPPIPSEAVLPLAGYLVSQGRMTRWGRAGGDGRLGGGGAGAVLARHGLGRGAGARAGEGARPLADGSATTWTDAQRWFEHHGRAAVFFARLAPLTRSLISIPPAWRRCRWGVPMSTLPTKMVTEPSACTAGTSRRRLGRGLPMSDRRWNCGPPRA